MCFNEFMETLMLNNFIRVSSLALSRSWKSVPCLPAGHDLFRLNPSVHYTTYIHCASFIVLPVKVILFCCTFPARMVLVKIKFGRKFWTRTNGCSCCGRTAFGEINGGYGGNVPFPNVLNVTKCSKFYQMFTMLPNVLNVISNVLWGTREPSKSDFQRCKRVTADPW